jgi:Protein of unknown function (DUF2865)
VSIIAAGEASRERGFQVVPLVSGRHNRPMIWRVAVVAAALAAAASAPDAARAQNIFDFLFGHPYQPPPPTNYPPPPSPQIGRVAPAPLGQERVNENAGTTGHGVAFCVRLCDGQHFPMERMANATPADTCKTICPTSATKVYFGSEITGAVAGDGARYSDLKTAFLYRKQLIANCTCNGKDPFGLVSFDVKTDPTLRPGDIVSTKDGLMTYSGRGGQAAFTPVSPAALGPQLNSVSSRQRAAQPSPPAAEQSQEIDDDPGTMVRPQQGAAPPQGMPAANPRAPASR